MKKVGILKITGIGLVITSIFLITFATINIVSAENRYRKSLKTWKEKNILIVQREGENKNINNENNASKDINKNLEYKNEIKNGEIMGKVTIFKTGEEIPIIQGTDEENLLKGAGHYLPSSLPGKEGNCIIFGHRDGAFSGLKGVNLKDLITIETYDGKFSYKVYDKKIVNPEDTYIIKGDRKYSITLVTCYPFYFIGNAPKRFVVKGELIN